MKKAFCKYFKNNQNIIIFTLKTNDSNLLNTPKCPPNRQMQTKHKF